MADNSVSLDIQVQIDEALKSLDKLEKSSQKSVDNISGFFTSLKTVAAAALAVVATKQIVDFFSDAAKAAAKNEQEVAKLGASLKALGDFTPEVLADFKEFSSTLQDNSKFSDEAALSSLAYAKQLGITNEKAKELVQAAADLASVTGDTLEGAVSELGRTLSGTAGALGRTIPEIKGLTEEQLKAGDAVKLVADRLKGAALDSIQTYSGAIQQTGNAHEDFLKAVGGIITKNPIVIASIKALGEAFKSLTQFISDNKEQINAFLTLLLKATLDVLPGVIKSLGVLFTGLGIFSKNFRDAGEKLAEFQVVAETAIRKIENADSDSAKAAKAAAEAQVLKGQAAVKANVEASRQAIIAAEAEKKHREELDKLTEKFISFQRSVLDKQSDDIAKIDYEREESLRQLQEFEAAGVIAVEKASELRKIINVKAEKDTKEARKKSLEEFKKDVEEAAKNPLALFFEIKPKDENALNNFGENLLRTGREFQNNLDDFFGVQHEIRISPDDSESKTFAKNVAQNVSRALGFVAASLKGKAGAEDLVKSAAAVMGDAILPGIGPVVGEIVGGLEKGKDAVIAMVREFTKELPNIIVNVLEALPYIIPELVTGLVDSLITKGGIVKIGVALVQAMLKSAGLLFQMGRQIAIGLGEGLGQSIKDGANQFAMAIKGAAPAISQAIQDGFNNALTGVKDFFSNLGSTFQDFFNGIGQAIVNGFLAAYNSLGGAFADAFKFSTGQLINSMVDAFKSAVAAIADDLKNAVTPGGGGPLIGGYAGSTFNKGLSGAKSAIGLAEGGVVPMGYPNDTFPARLSSGEAVVPGNIVDKLDYFLKTGGGNNQGSMTDSILLKVLAALERPQTVSTSINIGSRELAQAILELSRQNARLTA